MNYTALIENRKSVREFRSKAVSAALLDEIRAYYEKDCQRLVPEIGTELRILGTEAREALEGSAGYEDFLIGAPCYLVLLSEKHELAVENAGYMMEDLVLKLEDLDLAACWITFHDAKKVSAALNLPENLEVAAIAAFGYGQRAAKRIRLNILNMSNVDIKAKRGYFSPKKDVGEMVFVDKIGNVQGLEDRMGFYEDMLWQAFYAVAQTPSYLNRQPYAFVMKDQDVILVSMPDQYTDDTSRKLNLGIAMLHFGAVAGQWVGKVKWDFAAKDLLELPEGAEIAAVYHM